MKNLEYLIAKHFEVNSNEVFKIGKDIYNVNFAFNRNIASKTIQTSKVKLKQDYRFREILKTKNFYFYEYDV